MRHFVFLCLLASLAHADAARDYRSEIGKAKKAERRYWSEFRTNVMRGLTRMVEPFRNQQDNVAVYDLAGLRETFAAHTAIARRWVAAYAALGQSGHEKAGDLLLKELLAVAKKLERADDEFEDAKPLRLHLFDQEPAVRRAGLILRRRGLSAALAGWKELTTTGWTKATRADGKKSVERRVAIIEAAKDRAFLTARLAEQRPELRIAAVARLVPMGSDKALHAMLEDDSPVVRRAVLQEIRRATKYDARWIGPLVARVGKAKGLEQALVVKALHALTKQPFGHAPKKWPEWFDVYRKEIAGGTFDPKTIEIQEDKPRPAPGAFTYYGITTPSDAVAFVVDASRLMQTPAQWKVRAHKSSTAWRGEYNQWKDEFESHRGILEREVTRALQKMSGEAVWGMVFLDGKCMARSTGALRLDAKGQATAMKMIARMPCTGWNSTLWGLEAGAKLDERIDTVFLLHAGDFRGGRALTPELALAMFRRWNRFRRIVVHALRYDDRKEESARLMEGFAKATGGEYRWFAEPPK